MALLPWAPQTRQLIACLVPGAVLSGHTRRRFAAPDELLSVCPAGPQPGLLTLWWSNRCRMNCEGSAFSAPNQTKSIPWEGYCCCMPIRQSDWLAGSFALEVNEIDSGYCYVSYKQMAFLLIRLVSRFQGEMVDDRGLMKCFVAQGTGCQMPCDCAFSAPAKGFAWLQWFSRSSSWIPWIDEPSPPKGRGSGGLGGGPRICTSHKFLDALRLAWGAHFENCCLPGNNPVPWEAFGIVSLGYMEAVKRYEGALRETWDSHSCLPVSFVTSQRPLLLSGIFFSPLVFQRCPVSLWKYSQSCLTLCDPVDCSPPGFSVHGTLQARMLEWEAIPYSRASSQARDRTWVSHIAGSSLSTKYKGVTRALHPDLINT